MKREFLVVLDNVRSRENVGSIFRTADAVGVSKIYLCGITPVPNESNPSTHSTSAQGGERGRTTGSGFANKIAKTALGAEKWIPWEYHKQTWRLLKALKSKYVLRSDSTIKRILIIGLEKTPKSINIFKFKIPKNYSIVLVVGNEVKGLSSKILKYCDKKVFIPMRGKKESLNVAVAFGIAIYALTHKIS